MNEKHVKIQEFKKGDVIFKEGDRSRHFYLIINGKVEISKKTPKGKIILATQGVYTVFGEMASIDNNPRSATVIALEDTSCYECDAEGINSLISNTDPYIKKIIKHMVKTVRINNSKLAKEKLVLTSSFFDSVSIIDHAGKVTYQEDLVIPETKEALLEDMRLKNLLRGVNPVLAIIFRVLFATAFKENYP